MSRLSEIYSDLESMHIGERERSSEIVEQIDNIEGYRTVGHEELADFYRKHHGLFQNDDSGERFRANYFGLVMRESDFPAIQDERPAYNFVVAENRGLEQLTGDRTYAAAIGNGEIEVRDEELWENEDFQEIVSEWSNWRQNQRVLGTFGAEELKVHQNF